MYLGVSLCCMCFIYCCMFAVAYSQGWIFAKSEGGETSVGFGDCPEGEKQVCGCKPMNNTDGGGNTSNNNSNANNNNQTNESFENETDDDDDLAYDVLGA